MARTREVLKQLGAQSMDEAALVERGKETIRDLIQQTLRDAGVEDAVAFELKLKNGEETVISSDSNPVLDRPASDVAEGGVTVRQSARAGLTQVFRVLN